MGSLPSTNEGSIFYYHEGTINDLRDVLIAACGDNREMIEKILQLSFSSLITTFFNNLIIPNIQNKDACLSGVKIFAIKDQREELVFLVWSDQPIEIGLDRISEQSAIAFKKIIKLRKHIHDNDYTIKQAGGVLVEVVNEAITALKTNDPDIAERYRSFHITGDLKIFLELDSPCNFIEARTLEDVRHALATFDVDLTSSQFRCIFLKK